MWKSSDLYYCSQLKRIIENLGVVNETEEEQTRETTTGKVNVDKFSRCSDDMRDYIPCLDNGEAIKKLNSTEKGEKFELHCPQQGHGLNCFFFFLTLFVRKGAEGPSANKAYYLSYINLAGKYPPGLFANECREDKLGLLCNAQSPSQSAVALRCSSDSGQTAVATKNLRLLTKSFPSLRRL